MAIKKLIVVSFIDKAKDFYSNLVKSVADEERFGVKNSFNMQLLRSIFHQIDKIKIKFPRGDPVPKHLIPNKFKKEYNLLNLFHCELTQGWRMLYSFAKGKDNTEVLCIISIISSHKEYEKIMGYN